MLSKQTATSVTLQLSSEYPIDSIASKYDFEYNPANGKIVIYNVEGFGYGDVICTISYDLDVEPWAANGSYKIGVKVLAATNGDDELFGITGVQGYLVIDNDYPAGDADLSGNVTNADVIAIARYLVKLVDFTAKQMETADFDGNGVVNDADLVKVARAVVGAKF